MEIPLTPMEFARRARRLYAEREAVVDGELRLTFAQFFDRCDRWSSALKAFGGRGRIGSKVSLRGASSAQQKSLRKLTELLQCSERAIDPATRRQINNLRMLHFPHGQEDHTQRDRRDADARRQAHGNEGRRR